MTPDPRLARHLAARLCHDLGGAVGTLAGMLDLATPEESEMLELARETGASLRARLRLYAAAWGGASEPLAADGLTELLAGAPSAGRVTFDLDALTGTLPSPLVPLLLNAALLASEALPRGGQVLLAGDTAGLTVLPDGQGAAWPAELLRLLADPDPEPLLQAGPRHVLAPLFGSLLGELGWTADLALGPTLATPAPLLLYPAARVTAGPAPAP